MANPPTPPAPGGQKPGGGLQGALGNRRNLMIGGAGVVVLVAFVLSRGGKSGGSGSDVQAAAYDSTASDQYNDLQTQLQDIQRQIDSGEVTPGTATTPAPTPASPKPTPLPARPKPGVKPIVKPPTKPRPKPKPAPPKKWYEIKRGDTLSEIAQKQRVSMASLKRLNPVFWKNPKYDHGNTIFAGGKVRVR